MKDNWQKKDNDCVSCNFFFETDPVHFVVPSNQKVITQHGWSVGRILGSSEKMYHLQTKCY
jgi:hypothetical protein